MRILDKRLFRMIKSNKGQFIAVISIIVTGIFVFTALSNSAKNLSDSLDEYYSETNFADIFVTADNIPQNIQNLISREKGIKAIEKRITFNTAFISNDSNENVNVRVISANSKDDRINKLYIKKGNRSIDENEIIVIEQFAAARNIKVGDNIKLKINKVEQSFKVSAIASSPEFVYVMENEQTLLPNPEKFGVVFIEETYLRKLLGKSAQFNELLIEVRNNYDIEDTKKYLEDVLKDSKQLRIIKRSEQLSNSMISEEINGLKIMSKSIPFVFLAFAGTMLVTTLSRIIKKDRTTIGVFKAIGLTDTEIALHYLKYALIVGLIGGLAGSITGTVLSGVMTVKYLEFFNIPMLRIKVYYFRIIISVLMSLFICLLSGYIGVIGVMKINPAESMNLEAPKKGNRIFLENYRVIWNRLSFSSKMVSRNIFREKKKFAFIALAVCITCGMMVLTFWMANIIDIMFVKHYSEFMKMDYNISFDGFKSENTKKILKDELNAEFIEGRIEMPFEIQNGRKSKIVNIIGLEKNTSFYSFKDNEDNNILLPSSGILLSYNLAKYLNVEVGDEVLIKSFVSEKDDKYVNVKGIVSQSLGINGYVDIDFINKNFLDKKIINGVYLSADMDVSKVLNNYEDIKSIISKNEMRNAFEKYTSLIDVFIGVMVIFSGLLGFVIMYSMTLLSINERSIEFSSLRIMGFTNKEIFYIIIRENLIISIIGVIAGLPFGAWLVSYISTTFTTDIYTMSEKISLTNIIMSIISTFLFLILALMITSIKIQKLDLIKSLKNRIS